MEYSSKKARARMLAAININIHLFTVDKKFNIVSQQIELNLTKKLKILISII